MRFGKNLYYYAGAAFMTLALASVVSALADPGILTGFVLNAQSAAEEDAEEPYWVERDYGVSFAFPKRETEKVSLYIPEYDYIELPQAEELLGIFDIGDGRYGEMDVDGPFYTFIGERGQVQVNKYFNRIIADYGPAADSDGGRAVTETEAVARALEYLDNGGLDVNYEEIAITHPESGVTVVFYPLTGGLINHGHPVTVTMDEYGGVKGLDYFRLTYEKISSVKIISTKEAYYQLPPLESLGILSGPGLRADLNKCELVYVFWDSILQPAYYFEGQVINKDTGETAFFSHYVNASKFE